MSRKIICMALGLLAASLCHADVDWQKVCADDLGIDLTAPHEDYQPPALSVLSTQPYKDLVGVCAFADSNIYFFIANPNGKVLYTSNATEVYAFQPEDIKFEITGTDLDNKPGFALRYESFSGGSGMGDTDIHWQLFGRGQGGDYDLLLQLDSSIETIYSRWYGGDNVTAWTWGGTDGQRFTAQFIPLKGHYPLVLVRYEEFSAGDMHKPEEGKEDITNIWYQTYIYDREDGEYSQIDDGSDKNLRFLSPGLSALVAAKIYEDEQDYKDAYNVYQNLTGSPDEEARKVASLAVTRMTPSAKYDFEDLKLFTAQDYKTLQEKYPQSPLAARSIMMGENQSTEDLLGVIRDFPNTADAENAAFVILYNGIGTAIEADHPNYDKAMDYLKSMITDPEQLAYYYALYGDCLFGMAVTDSYNKEILKAAMAAYDSGSKADPEGNFSGYLILAHAKALAASGDVKGAMGEMIRYLKGKPDDWWTGNAWDWLSEHVKGAKEGEIGFGGGEIAEIGTGQSLVLSAIMLSGGNEQYWSYVYTVKGTELVEQLRLEGTLYETWNADVMGKGSNDILLRRTTENDHLILLSMSGGKVKQLLDADLGGAYDKKPEVVVESVSYPANLTVKLESKDLHFIYNKAKGVYEAK